MPTDNAPENTMVDGGTPTAEEARLAAELDAAGDGAAELAAAATQAANGEAAGGDDAAAAAAGDDDGAGDGDDAAAAEAAAPAPAPAPAPEPQMEEPKPPYDFEAEYQKVQEEFDNGIKDAAEFQARVREISRDETAFTARAEIYKERLQTQAQRRQAEFQTAAAAWEARHKAFIANELNAKAMQDAINLIDQRTPGLPAAELLTRAERIAFEFAHYTPPAAADPNAGKREALAKANRDRTPPKVPTTLSGAPTAAHVDASAGSAFSGLDALDIDNLENRLARMSPDQVEAYLADAPGAGANGQ